MELSIFVAKIIGVIYIAMSIGVLMGTISYKKMFQDIIKTPAINPLMSLFGIVIGMILIEYHNIWVWDWPVIITLIGWIGVVKGINFMIFPGFTKWFEPMFTGSFMKIMPYFTLVFGLLMAYFGFVA
ncbi:hypothetical protein KJ742_03315 [Patescibacteria group bacterium]|nr:hypothetical protein [Patescibacteria group bacterium]MBU1682950.1 hypothetical protein [Patescibacteria group bacterium]MBU1934920.1 hypothetical protein [Patescibacteria group bacterium]